ncbi:MAG TPA: NADH-quinone oxidoreductase subunit C [Kofleriaceae bacterium]|nr:NADH-quinone oxidoreductase subunit C [Kofleriaceae bacterium]
MAQKVIDAIVAKFGDAVTAQESEHGDEQIEVRADKLLAIAEHLKSDPALAFDMPIFCTCIDRLDFGEEPRFAVLYQLRSTTHKHRIRLRVLTGEDNPTCPSLTGVWKGLVWQERETFDMYGIKFEGHPDLRRIYMYDEFVGHPLRKDYPKDKRQPLVRRDFGTT